MKQTWTVTFNSVDNYVMKVKAVHAKFISDTCVSFDGVVLEFDCEIFSLSADGILVD